MFEAARLVCHVREQVLLAAGAGVALGEFGCQASVLSSASQVFAACFILGGVELAKLGGAVLAMGGRDAAGARLP